MPKRTDDEIRHDLQKGLDLARNDIVAIGLADLRAAVGREHVREFLGEDYPDDYIDGDNFESVKLVRASAGAKPYERRETRNVHVQREKLLEHLETLAKLKAEGEARAAAAAGSGNPKKDQTKSDKQ